MTPGAACHDACTGHCSGDLPVEIWIGERFPLLPIDVYMLFVDELQLDLHTCGEPPSVWIPICARASEPLTYAEDPATDQAGGQAGGQPADPGGGAPQSFLYAPTCHDWLLDRMRPLDDLFDTDQFYDDYMEKHKEEHGYFPKDSARNFARITDRCRREIQEERRRASPNGPPPA